MSLRENPETASGLNLIIFAVVHADLDAGGRRYADLDYVACLAR